MSFQLFLGPKGSNSRSDVAASLMQKSFDPGGKQNQFYHVLPLCIFRDGGSKADTEIKNSKDIR